MGKISRALANVTDPKKSHVTDIPHPTDTFKIALLGGKALRTAVPCALATAGVTDEEWLSICDAVDVQLSPARKCQLLCCYLGCLPCLLLFSPLFLMIPQNTKFWDGELPTIDECTLMSACPIKCMGMWNGIQDARARLSPDYRTSSSPACDAECNIEACCWDRCECAQGVSGCSVVPHPSPPPATPPPPPPSSPPPSPPKFGNCTVDWTVCSAWSNLGSGCDQQYNTLACCYDGCACNPDYCKPIYTGLPANPPEAPPYSRPPSPPPSPPPPRPKPGYPPPPPPPTPSGRIQTLNRVKWFQDLRLISLIAPAITLVLINLVCKGVVNARTFAGLKQACAQMEKLCRRRSLKMWPISEMVIHRKGRSSVVYSLGIASTLPPPDGVVASLIVPIPTTTVSVQV